MEILLQGRKMICVIHRARRHTAMAMKCVALSIILFQNATLAETVVGTQSKSDVSQVNVNDPLLIYAQKEDGHDLLLEVFQNGKLVQQRISQDNFFALRAQKAGSYQYKIYSSDGDEKMLLSSGQIRVDSHGGRKISSVGSAAKASPSASTSSISEKSSQDFALHLETFSSRIWTKPRIEASLPPVKSASIAVSAAKRWNKSVAELIFQTKVASLNSDANPSSQKSLEARYKYILQGEKLGLGAPPSGKVQASLFTGMEAFRDNNSIQTPKYEMLKLGFDLKGGIYRFLGLEADGSAGQSINDGSHKFAFGISLLLNLGHQYTGQFGYRTNFLTMASSGSSPANAELPYRQSTEDLFLGLTSTF